MATNPPWVPPQQSAVAQTVSGGDSYFLAVWLWERYFLSAYTFPCETEMITLSVSRIVVELREVHVLAQGLVHLVDVQ